MRSIYNDILEQWTVCWQGSIFTGVLFVTISRWIRSRSFREWRSIALHFADGVFIYYLLHVTLLSRTIGSRREVVLLPFACLGAINKEFQYVIENVLLFIPFGMLLCLTLYIYGKKCGLGLVVLLSFLSSASIELLQYMLSCGKSETDDVITNISGAVIGYLFVKLIRKK